MKKECDHTRKSLRRYLRGHLFKPSQLRVERHLKKCPVCSSEFQALRHASETRQFLKDLSPPEGFFQRMRAGLSNLSVLTKIIYRPLWIAGIAAVAGAVYYYAAAPRQIDAELESIVKSVPSITAQTASGTTSTAAVMPLSSVPTVTASPASPPTSAAAIVEPLSITIIVDDEKAGTRKINQLLRGQAAFRKKKFSESVRELSGDMNSKDLFALFSRLEEAGKMKYSRTRLDSFPSAQPIPFILKLKVAARATDKQSVSTPATGNQPVKRPPAQ